MTTRLPGMEKQPPNQAGYGLKLGLVTLVCARSLMRLEELRRVSGHRPRGVSSRGIDEFSRRGFLHGQDSHSAAFRQESESPLQQDK